MRPGSSSTCSRASASERLMRTPVASIRERTISIDRARLPFYSDPSETASAPEARQIPKTLDPGSSTASATAISSLLYRVLQSLDAATTTLFEPITDDHCNAE